MMARMMMLVLVAAALAPVSVSAQALTARQAAKNTVEHYFRPGYRALLTHARGSESRMQMLCASPDANHLRAARAAFGDLVAAWSRIEMVRFGPVIEDNRLERILFWPDRRGIGLRQVQALLAEKDESATSAESLHAKSVAVQGLVAFEYVLFGTDSDDLAKNPASFRCRYGRAIAGNIANIAERLDEEWSAADGIAARFTRPGPENPLFRTDQEALSEIVGVLAHGFETIRDTRLRPMMGDDAEHARPKSALFWRSGQTMPSIGANFAGLQQLFEGSRIGAVLAGDEDAVVNSIQFEFRNVDRMLPTIPPQVETAVSEKKERSKLDYVYLLTRSLQGLIGRELSAALGLSVGFSSSDGD